MDELRLQDDDYSKFAANQGDQCNQKIRHASDYDKILSPHKDPDPQRRAWGSISQDNSIQKPIAKEREIRRDNIRDRSERGCWSLFIGCAGGMWSTRQLTKKEDREAYVRTTLRELFIYLIFLAIFCIITFAQTTYTMYYYTRVIQDLFLDTPYIDTRNNLRGSTQVMDFWRFSQTVLLDGLFWEYWYDPEMKPTREVDKSVLFENILLGRPRMRQKRMTNDSCTIPIIMNRNKKPCYDLYDDSKEDKSDFRGGISEAFKHKTDDGMAVWGKLGIYGSGGFSLIFPNTKNKTKAEIDFLRENIWVDRGTRAVLIDFTVYNPNLNLFCIVKIIVEFPPMGGIIPSWTFRTVKLLRYVTPLDYFVMACEFIFLFFVFYYIIEEALEIAALKSVYFKSIWNILDLIVIGLSLIVIGYNVYNYITIEPRLEKLLDYPDEFANFEEMGYWQVQFNSIVAVCIFFSWFKLFKYISFNKTMTQLSQTLSRCAKDVAGFAVMFFIVFFAFSQLGYLIFGSQVFDFHTFIDSVFTLLRTILGDFNFREMQEANRILGPIFFLSYVFFVFFILLNMFLAIINDTYSEVKEEISTKKNELEIADYFKRGLNNARGKLAKRDKKIDMESALKLEETDNKLAYRQVRSVLKNCNFSEKEVEQFFTHYDIEKNRVLGRQELLAMYNDLGGRGADQTDRYTRPELTQYNSSVGAVQIASPSPFGINRSELDAFNERVDVLAHLMAKSSDDLTKLGHKLDNLDRKKSYKRDAQAKFLDMLTAGVDDDHLSIITSPTKK